jgi:hypothetical protein
MPKRVNTSSREKSHPFAPPTVTLPKFRQGNDQQSISSRFYVRIFHTNVLCAPSYVLALKFFGAKISAKKAHKTLMKLTP